MPKRIRMVSCATWVESLWFWLIMADQYSPISLAPRIARTETDSCSQVGGDSCGWNLTYQLIHYLTIVLDLILPVNSQLLPALHIIFGTGALLLALKNLEMASQSPLMAVAWRKEFQLLSGQFLGTVTNFSHISWLTSAKWWNGPQQETYHLINKHGCWKSPYLNRKIISCSFSSLAKGTFKKCLLIQIWKTISCQCIDMYRPYVHSNMLTCHLQLYISCHVRSGNLI